MRFQKGESGENIDCIEYSSVLRCFIARALSPALVNSVKNRRTSKMVEKKR